MNSSSDSAPPVGNVVARFDNQIRTFRSHAAGGRPTLRRAAARNPPLNGVQSMNSVRGRLGSFDVTLEEIGRASG